MTAMLVLSVEVKKYEGGVTSNGIMFILIFIKINPLSQKLESGG